MKRASGFLVASLLACSLSLAGCGRMFLDPRPSEAYEKAKAKEARAEAASMRYMEDNQSDPATVLRDADRFVLSGNLDRAIAGYVDLIQGDPTNPIPQARIANLQIVRDPERAEGLFRRLVNREPEMAIAHAGLGLAMLALNRMGDAEASLQRALELNPDLANAHYGLSVVRDLEGRHEEAQQHARRARELRPRDATVANNLGVSYLLSANFEEAEVVLRDALLLDPDDPAIRNNLAVALARQDRFDEALTQLERTGTEQAAHNNLGYLLLIANRFDEAIVHFERALEAGGPDTVLVLRNMTAALDARDAPLPAAVAPNAP
jgi:Flp pilus assembly protein TadD